jgi:hypothetical protein
MGRIASIERSIERRASGRDYVLVKSKPVYISATGGPYLSVQLQ